MKTSTIFLILSTLLVGGGVYWYTFVRSGNEPAITADGTINQDQLQFESLAGQLPTTLVKTPSIFDDSRLFALVDITIPLASETPGRTDPMAPIGTIDSQRATSTATSTASTILR